MSEPPRQSRLRRLWASKDDLASTERRLQNRLAKQHRAAEELHATQKEATKRLLDERVARLEQQGRHLDEQLKIRVAAGTDDTKTHLSSGFARSTDELSSRMTELLDYRRDAMRGELRALIRQLVEETNVDLGRLDYPPAEILLRLRGVRSTLRLRSAGKEPWTVDWIERWVSSDDVLYDVGANVGAYALVAAKKAGGVGSVLAFEPGAATFALLCENIVLNGVASVVTPLPLTLSDETALAAFEYNDLEAGAGSHSLAPLAAPAARSDLLYRQPVVAYRLDDLIRTFGLAPPNHVKLDVDGAELAVLRGAVETLSSPGLRSVMIELHADEAEEATALLEDCGLPLRTRWDEREKDGEPVGYWYALFARDAEPPVTGVAG